MTSEEYGDLLYTFLGQLAEDFSEPFSGPLDELSVSVQLPTKDVGPWIYATLEVEGWINLAWLDQLDSRVREWVYVNGGALHDITVTPRDRVLDVMIKLHTPKTDTLKPETE